MVDQKVIDLYAEIRKDNALVDRLLSAADLAELLATIKAIGDEKGVALDDEEVTAAIGEADAIIEQAAGGDNLTDMELELVSGGSIFGSLGNTFSSVGAAGVVNTDVIAAAGKQKK